MTRSIHLSSLSAVVHCQEVSTGPSQSTGDRTFHDPRCHTGKCFSLALCSYLDLDSPREGCKFFAGVHVGDERSGGISHCPVLAQFLTCDRQGDVGDHSLIRPSAVVESRPSSACRGPASSKPDIRVAWQTRVVWLPLLLATTKGAKLLSPAVFNVP